MSYIVFFTILFASFFHALWNFFIKKSTADKTSLLIIGWVGFGLLLFPAFLYYEDLSLIRLEVWALTALACVIHASYIFFLGWGYSLSDLSTLYPIARGCGVALTSLLYFFIFDHSSLSFQGMIGILSIVGGAFFIGIQSVNTLSVKGFVATLLVAVCIASYSLMDSFLIHKVSLLFYLTVTSLGAGFLSLLLYRKKWKRVFNVIKYNKKEISIIVVGGNLSYVVMLWAFTQVKAPYVVALREFSIVVASLLAYVYLKEHFYRSKWLGVGFIFIGLVVLKLI